MFSVIIPLYNKEASIKRTIHSVLNQKFKEFELLVVNDGSTDNSFEVVKEINDDRIRLIDQSNQGVSAARNRGIIEAQFNWITFLDADDFWFENHLEEVMKMTKSFQNEKVFTTSFKYSDNRYLFKHQRKSTIFKVENYFKEAIKEVLVWTGTIVVHKDCFESVGMFNVNLKIGEDTELWNRLIRRYGLVKSNVITAIYRIDAENRTTLSKELETTYVYNVDLSRINNIDELLYFKEMITNRLYQYARARDFYNFKKLKNRHSTINYISIFKYSAKHIRSRIIKKLLIK